MVGFPFNKENVNNALWGYIDSMKVMYFAIITMLHYPFSLTSFYITAFIRKNKDKQFM